VIGLVDRVVVQTNYPRLLMTLADTKTQPSWETPLSLKVTPEGLITALFTTATEVHTSWESCIASEHILHEVTVSDDTEGNYCRLIEQEYKSSEDEDAPWRDWTVEIKLGEVFITGHWQIPVSSSPFEWEWCEKKSTTAFGKACLLFGKRVHRGGLVIEEAFDPDSASKATHH